MGQQAPAGAGGAGGAAGPLDFLRSNPQFIALRQIVQSNPMILQPMLQVLVLRLSLPVTLSIHNFYLCSSRTSSLPAHGSRYCKHRS